MASKSHYSLHLKKLFCRIYHKSLKFQDHKYPEAMLSALKPFQIQVILSNSTRWLNTLCSGCNVNSSLSGAAFFLQNMHLRKNNLQVS